MCVQLTNLIFLIEKKQNKTSCIRIVREGDRLKFIENEMRVQESPELFFFDIYLFPEKRFKVKVDVRR